MKKIYKYKIPIEDFPFLFLHKGYEILCLDLQFGIPCVWALVDQDAELEHVDFVWYGTGWELNSSGADMHYVGTVQEPPYVWHLFRIED